VKRRLLAAEFWRRAGDFARSRGILEELADDLPPGPERAEVLRLLAGVVFVTARGIELCYQALDEASAAPLARANVRTDLADYLWHAGDARRSLEQAEAAVRDAQKAGDAQAIAISIAQLCSHQAVRALPWDREAMSRALALEREIDDFPDYVRPSLQLGIMATYIDDYDVARPLLVAEVARMERAGRAGQQGLALHYLARCDLRAGRWDAALQSARSALELLLQANDDSEVVLGETTFALVLAHLGDLDEAERLSLQALERAQPWPLRVIAARGVAGFVAHSGGDYEGALELLTPGRGALVDSGILEFSPHAVVENEIEALVAVGRIDEAEKVVQLVSDAGEPAARSWHRAVAARGQALTSSARGEVDAARAALARALVAHERLPQPFELGRTLLVKGQIERRSKSRGPARDTLTRALAIFDELGAAIWAERTAAELARIPGRVRASDELAETERRVAELVAAGLSNREVADRLFITVRTVEGNLTKAYEKLGIRSRTELASRLRS
jgi:DNA-binding CsgD family transcriptional regulator